MLTITIEEKNLEEYETSLIQMYTLECVDICQALIVQKLTFYGLHSPGLTLEGFDKHLRLLEGYKKVQKAKRVHIKK